MSDLTDSLQAEDPILAPSLDLKASSIDSNLRSIRQVESTWRLPSLPDEVRLDLAANPAITSDNLSAFLFQLDRDVFEENEEDLPPAPTVPTFRVVNPVEPYSDIRQSSFEQAAGLITELRGQKQSEVLDGNAVQRWKMKAIEGGFLAPDPSGVVDGSWSPELYSLQREMAYEEYDNRLRGDRPGAMPIGGENGVLKLLNDWTSPSGLLRAAVDLDLWWDVGQVGKEFSSWGDKWRKVGDSKNPLDFGRNLFDAMTGPIDDLAVPVLNMALLFSGVGAGTNFARLGLTGLRGGEAVAAFRNASKLYEVPKVGALMERIFPALNTGKAAYAAADGLAQGSLLANKLAKGTGMAGDVGRAMQAWRQLPSVVATRRGVQTGMRLGFTQQVQDLLPNYEGASLGDNNAVATAADRILRNPLATTMGEILFTPYTTFEPGTFVRGGGDAVKGAFRFLGTAPGRAVAGGIAGAGIGALEGDTEEVLGGAAIGAGLGAAAPVAGQVLSSGRALRLPVVSKLVGNVGDFLQSTSYVPLGTDQRATALFANALRSKMTDDEWSTFEGGMRSKGFLRAFADHVGTDEEGAGAAMAYTLVSGAIDHTAAQQAKLLGDSKGARQRYWLARNKLHAQITTWGPDTTKEELVWAIVSKEATSRKGLRRRYEIALDAFDDTQLAEAIAAHNEQARLTLQQLLSGENLPVAGLDDVSLGNLGKIDGVDDRFAAMESYVANAMDSFGNWGQYQPLTSDLRTHIGAGLFEEARLRAPKSAFGRNLKMLDHLDEFAEEFDDEAVNWAEHVNDTLFIDRGVSMEQWRQAGGYYNPLARELNPSKARFTLAKKETISKQHLIETADEIQNVLEMAKAWRSAIGLSGGDATAIIADGKIGTLSVTEMTEYLKVLGLNKDSINGKALKRLNRLAKQAGLPVDTAFARTLDAYAAELAADPRWVDTYGLLPDVRSPDGRALQGLDALQARQKALRNEAKFRAAEVDHDALVGGLREAGKTAEADELEAFFRHADSQGYKIVYGQDFLAPDDLLHRTGMFTDINHRHMNAMTLGNFFGRKHPEALAQKVQRYRQIGIARELGRARGTTIGPEDAEIQQVIFDLQPLLDQELARNANMVDDLRHQSWLDKRTTSIRNANMPRSLQDLGLGKHRGRVVDYLKKLDYSETDAAAIWQGLKAGRFADWSDQGLYAIEAKLRGNNQMLDVLRLLSGTTEGKKLRNTVMKGTAPLLGATAGIVQAQSMADEGTDASLGDMALGGVLGAAAGAGVGYGLGKAADALDYTKWARYGYLADNMAAFRDKMRFALSPFFDISRYTEAFALNQIGGPMRGPDGERIGIPLNASPSKLRKKIGDFEFTKVVDEMRSASKGMIDHTELDATDRWFQEVGIMGFNPTNWMASSFHAMRQNGLAPDEAWERVREMYTYGTHGRSAAEMSVNFIFFPFSFQKKTITHAAKFLADDQMRAVLLHDAYQAYQILDEKYDLDQWMEDHLPALEKLQQLNLFAFGISPGRLGGINAPFVDALVGDPTNRDPARRGLVFNLFNPVGVDASGGNREAIQAAMRRTIPAINDLHHMLEDAKEQGHVLFGPEHMTRRAEITKGYEEWGEFKKGIDEALKQTGASFYDLYNDPGMAPLLQVYIEKKTELEKRYPAWAQSKLDAQANRAELEQERQIRLNTVQYQPEEASDADRMFASMEAFIANKKARLAEEGITDIYDAPPAVLDEIRGVGIEMASKSRAFEMIWKKFYLREFGPIAGPVS